jgi:hypothetical protein
VTLARAGARLGVAGLFMLGASNALQNASAEGDTRTLSFHHVHTNEDITITFKRNGRYDDAALKKLDWFMRDWRKEKSTRMDPHLFDLLWEAYREVGATQPIDVVCGYRSPETNSMLAPPLERRRAVQPAHQWPGDGLLHSWRSAREDSRRSVFGCSAAGWVSTRPPARLSSTWTRHHPALAAHDA